MVLSQAASAVCLSQTSVDFSYLLFALHFPSSIFTVLLVGLRCITMEHQRTEPPPESPEQQETEEQTPLEKKKLVRSALLKHHFAFLQKQRNMIQDAIRKADATRLAPGFKTETELADQMVSTYMR